MFSRELPVDQSQPSPAGRLFDYRFRDPETLLEGKLARRDVAFKILPLSAAALFFSLPLVRSLAESLDFSPPPVPADEPPKDSLDQQQISEVDQASAVTSSQPETAETRNAEAIQTGIDLLEHFGLKDRIVYVVYGRPSKYGEPAWGSLSQTRTAEESWQLVETRKQEVRSQLQESGQPVPDYGLAVLNPVYFSKNGPITDVYVAKALELAPQHNGVVALNFNSLEEAERIVDHFSETLPPQLLPYLSVSLDIEHTSQRTVDAKDVNRFASWYAGLHNRWDPERKVPGFVFLYTIHPQGAIGGITNLNKLQQYYGDEGTFVVPITDGFGTASQKMPALVSLINGLEPNTPEFPALAGSMEFVNKWGNIYDKSEVHEIFANLTGAPVFFFASQ